MEAIKKGDYVVARHENKTILVRVLSIGGGTIRGKWEYKDQETDVEVDEEAVRANLGPDPQIGKVYGCNTERLLDVTSEGPFKHVEWYFQAAEDVRSGIMKGLMEGAKLLRKHDLHRILKVVRTRILFNPQATVTAKSILGTYRCRGGSEDLPDELTVRYHADAEGQWPYLLCHEAAHGIWFRLVPADLKVQWIKAFAGRTKLEFSDDACEEALKEACRTQSLKLDTPEAQDALDFALGFVEGTTGLRRRDIALLLDQDRSAARAILSNWRHLRYYESERDTLVTDYANTNVDEFFAESLAAHLTGRSIPDYLKELLAETLEAVEGRDVLVITD